MVNPIHLSLSVRVFNTADEAISAGFDWKEVNPPLHPIEVKRVVVIRQGTQQGHPTIDFQLVDDTGKQFVFCVTQRLLRMLAGFAGPLLDGDTHHNSEKQV